MGFKAREPQGLLQAIERLIASGQALAALQLTQ